MKNLVGLVLYSTFLVAASMSGAAAEQKYNSCHCIEGTDQCLTVDPSEGVKTVKASQCPK
ncbi:hypothetical protein Brsp02_04043 [Brucella sp. NBRC 113783]